MAAINEVNLNNATVKKACQAAKHRWIKADNTFWKKFELFLNSEVKESHRSNGIKLATCCWTLLRRKGGYYEPHKDVVSLSKVCKDPKVSLAEFMKLADNHGFKTTSYMQIPYLDIPHLEEKDEPIQEDRLIVGIFFPHLTTQKQADPAPDLDSKSLSPMLSEEDDGVWLTEG